ncbi:MAG: DNA cytosine methyltransferase [Rhodobacter sp.]|nr:DNA cytosine methyltransferase [Rhodobacter sp.]
MNSVSQSAPVTVVDFFSCGGGTTAGFARRGGFEIKAAVDLEVAKPSSGKGSSECNLTFHANHGITPLNRDMMTLTPEEFRSETGIQKGGVGVMISCAPCTHLSRANPMNHLVDKEENTLIGRSGDFAVDLLPDLFFMENARELIMGNYSHHHKALVAQLRQAGFDVRSDVHLLSQFGLPQIRERALVVASRIGPARTLEDLWQGWAVKPEAVTVRTALARLADWKAGHPDDPDGDAYPGMNTLTLERLAATPKDGGGWADVGHDPKTRHLLTPDCLRRWEAKDFGSHPDVYGRMWLDRPAPTIKRECAHVGNGRYSHPEQDRLLTVREMATLQGFPFDYRFPAKSVSNRYRHIGDAVPPIISWQMSALANWMRSGVKPEVEEWVMPNTYLRSGDIVRASGVHSSPRPSRVKEVAQLQMSI